MELGTGRPALLFRPDLVRARIPAWRRSDRYVFAMTFAIDGSGQHASFTASGAFDARTREGTLVETIAGHRLAGAVSRQRTTTA